MKFGVVAAVVVSMALVPACDSAESGPHDVEIVVELQRGHAFTASGDAVDAGLICPAGQRMEVGHLDLDGETRLSIAEFSERLRVAQQTDGEIVEFQFEVEFACADGSGIVYAIDQPSSWWEVTGGVGSYVGLTGEGTSTMEVSGPPVEPDDLPEGMPEILRFTGVLEQP